MNVLGNFCNHQKVFLQKVFSVVSSVSESITHPHFKLPSQSYCVHTANVHDALDDYTCSKLRTELSVLQLKNKTLMG